MVKCCTVVLACFLILSVILLVGSLVLILKVFPDLVYDELNEQVRLENGTEAFDRFVELPFPMDFKVYVFNVTNANEVLQGAKPILNELGPYVYREYRSKTILEEDEDEDSIEYVQSLSFVFDQEASGEFQELDEVTILNAPLMVMYTTLGSNCYSDLFEEDQKQIFAKLTVKQLLFDGFHFCQTHGSGLCIFANTGACVIADTTKFTNSLEDHSLYFSMFNYKVRDYDGIYTVSRGIKDISTLGTILRWNNSTYLDNWGNETECDKIKGTDIQVIPPRISKDDSLFIYSTDICRSVEVKYSGTGSYNGIDGYYFQTDNETFRSSCDNVTEDCFCAEEAKRTPGLDGEKTCWLDGIMDLQPCVDVPILLSFPHFMGAEQYLEYVDGLNPDPTKHQTFLLIEPNTGTPLQGYQRIQINAVLRPFKNVAETTNVSTSLLPLLWIEEGVNIPQDYVDKLNNDYFTKMKIVDGVQYSLLALSIVLVIIFTIAVVLVHFRSRKVTV